MQRRFLDNVKTLKSESGRRQKQGWLQAPAFQAGAWGGSPCVFAPKQERGWWRACSGNSAAASVFQLKLPRNCRHRGNTRATLIAHGLPPRHPGWQFGTLLRAAKK